MFARVHDVFIVKGHSTTVNADPFHDLNDVNKSANRRALCGRRVRKSRKGQSSCHLVIAQLCLISKQMIHYYYCYNTTALWERNKGRLIHT